MYVYFEKGFCDLCYMIFGWGPFRLGIWYLGEVHSALVYDIWARSIPSWFMIFMDEVYSVLFLRHVHYILLFEFLDFKLWKWCLWICIAIYNYALVILLIDLTVVLFFIYMCGFIRYFVITYFVTLIHSLSPVIDEPPCQENNSSTLNLSSRNSSSYHSWMSWSFLGCY